jgi:arylsulfatase A-like enzyme
MITCIDDAIGRVLSALARSRHADNTVLIFTTDHGDHLGDHKLLLKGAEHYQAIVHVPFIWAEARGRGARRTDALGSTMDIPATVLDRAGLAPYAGMQGLSLMPTIADGEPVQDALLIQYEHQMAAPAGQGSGRVHTVLDGRWRLSIFDGADFGELYDLENDPGEFDNLWASAEHAGVRADLTERIARLEIGYIDKVPLPTRQA